MPASNTRRTTPFLGYSDIRSMPVYIYGLADPRTGEIRYVGKSSSPAARLASHRARSGARAVRGWCRDLDRDGARPVVIELFAVLPGQDVDPWERHFIAMHDGPRLLNARGACGEISRGLNLRAHRARAAARITPTEAA